MSSLLDSKESRKNWEETFNKVYIQPVLEVTFTVDREIFATKIFSSTRWATKIKREKLKGVYVLRCGTIERWNIFNAKI